MENREQIYAKGLGTLIKKETVSFYGDVDLTKFYDFVETLKKTFPSVFSVCQVEDFDGSLLLRWKGKDGTKEPIMFMNHYDVVSGEGDWKHPAFSGEVFDGKLWGRGTLDTKGGLYCMLQGAEELLKDGFVPSRDIYFESARTEETDGTGADTISKELKKRGVHFAYTLDEGGMILHDPIGGADGDFAMVGIGEKNSLTIDFIARSKGGHASMPGKNTPLVRLAKFITKVESPNLFKREITPAVQELFKRSATKMKGPLKFILGNAKLFAPILKIVLPAFSPAAGAMIQTTVAFTMAEGAESFNSLPQRAVVTVNMRASLHQGSESSLNAIKKIADKYDIEMVVTDAGLDSGVTDYKGEAYKQVEDTIREVFPDVVPTPYVTMTASDSRFMSRVSDNCIRFAPFFISDEQLGGIHGLNENIDVSALPKAVDFYKKLMEKA